MIKEAYETHAIEIGHIPLHQRALAWGMKKSVEPVQLVDNSMPYRFVVVK